MAIATAGTKKAASPKTTTFSYEGLDRRGKKVKGELSSISQPIARAELRKQGIMVKKIHKKGVSLFGEKKRSIKSDDISRFSRQLATMMKSGVPLISAFTIAAEGLESNMRALVLEIKNEVEGGNSLEHALRQHPKHFDDLFCSLVGSGEQSGALEVMLDRIATYKEKSEALKSKLKKAVKYPIAVVSVAVIVTVILLVKVVPTFESLFSSFGADLPVPTKIVIGMSEWMQANWFIIIAFMIGVPVGLIKLKQRSQKFGDILDRISVKLPITGDLVMKATVARFARTLSTTFAAGVPLVEALDSVARATGNVIYRNAVIQVKDDVAAGTQLQVAMRSTGVFPSMAIQMVSIGEESGALDAMLDKVASYYEMEVDDAVDGLTSMLEPIIMSVLGVLIGGLIIAMYLPIFSMGKAV
ncbi:MAG: type II secretion system F family protein [Pseudomonadota bacterium]